MQTSLGLGQHPECGQRTTMHPVGQLRLGHDGGDHRCGAGRWCRLGMHMHLGAGDTRAQHRLGLDGPAAHWQAAEHGTQFVNVGTSIDERTERHIASDAREAVEPGHPRVWSIGLGDGHALPGDRPIGHDVVLGVGVGVGVDLGMNVITIMIMWFRHRNAPTPWR
jgi:hypothetical protein